MRIGKHLLRFLLLFCAVKTPAQQSPFVHYTPRDGLVNNRARFFYQDKKGRLYIATYGGLSIYDGARFINYTTDNGLIAGLVNDVVEMGEDSVWIIPNGQMIHCLVHGRLKNIETSDHFYPVINQLVKAADGTCYAAADEGFFHFENNRFVRIPLTDKAGREIGLFLSHAVTLGRQIFLLTDPYLDKFPGPGKLLIYNIDTKQLETPRPPAPFSSITLTPDKKIWLSSAIGIETFDPEKGRISPAPISLPTGFLANFVYFDRHKNPWFSGNNGVCTVNRNTGTKQTFTPANGLLTGVNASIFQDREGTMWFANEESGVTKLADRDIQMLDAPAPGFPARIIYSSPANDSVWFFNARNNDLLLLDRHRPTRFYCTSAIASEAVTLIMSPIPYLITKHHIYRLVFLAANSYKARCIVTDTISSFGNWIEDKKGNLIAVSDQLTTLFSGRIVRRPLPAYADQPVIDKDNRLWLAMRTNQLLTTAIISSDTGFSLEPLQTIDTRRLPSISPRSLAVDRSGRVWIGTRDNGLFCLTLKQHRLIDWKQWTVKDGLAGNFVTSLLCDPDNTLWAGTSTGLDQVNINGDRLTILHRTNGFHNYPFVLSILPAAGGIHWAVTRSGLLRITTPDTPADIAPPPAIVFSSILSGNRPVDLRIDLPPDQNNLHFYIATPSLVDETQTRFQYRLEGGTNTEWSAPSTRGDINFDNLPPGRYRLYTKALFFGRYPDPETHLDFRIRPHWWQTTGFRIAALLMAASLILIGVRFYSRRKLEKQRTLLERQQAVEKERTRIAMDMHDDLGAGLTRIKFMTEDIAQKPGYAEQGTLLEKIRDSSNELVDKMGEIIWAMNEKNNTLEDLLFYLRAYAVDYCQDNGLACEFILPADIPDCQVSGQTRRNIFLILKESLHNIVKHAGARKVLIGINTGAGLLLQVTDDGSGFDPDTPPSGNGLLNMEFRASAMNGTLKILHRKPATVLLKIPL